MLKDGHVNRLGDVCIHTGIQRFLNVLRENAGSHGDNRDYVRSGMTAGTDGPRRRIAVHVWHLNVHEDHVIFVRFRALKHRDGFSAIVCPTAEDALAVLQQLDENLSV